MRLPLNRIGGAFAALTVVVTGAVALDIDPTIVTRVSNPVDGVWVPVELTGEVVKIDGATGDATARVSVAEPGVRLDVDETDEALVVADRSTGDVIVVDRALHEVDRSVSTGLVGTSLVDASAAGVVLGTGARIARIDADLTEATVADTTGTVDSLALDGEGTVVALPSGVARLDAAGAVVETDAIDAPVVVRAGDDVVVFDGSSLQALDGGGRACLDLTPGTSAMWAGHASGLVVVADGAEGIVQIADLGDESCEAVQIAEPGSLLGRPAVAGDRVYVPEPSAGIVHIIDPDATEDAVRATVARAGTRLQIHVRDDLVVAHDPVTAVGAVLDAEGVVARVNSRDVDPALRAQLGESGLVAAAGGGEDSPTVGFDGATGIETTATGTGADTSVLAEVIDADDVDDDTAVNENVDELVANFAFSTDTALVDEVVRFVDESTGSPTSWVWDFGDGDGATGPIVEKSWSAPGTYTVTLFIEREGVTAEVSLPIVVVPPEAELPPAADFTFSAAKVGVGDAVQFEDRSTGQVDLRQWEFGDGETSEDANPSKAWSQPGVYTVSLTVANDLGSDSAQVTIEVVLELAPPVAAIVTAPASVEAGARIDLVGRSTGGPASLQWSFGDGNQAVGSRVSHSYADPGLYTVRLAARNDFGTSEDSRVIEVVESTTAPIARIATLPEIIEVGDVVALTSLTLNQPDTETWTFGDGSSATGTTVEHAWATPGDYLVTLTATNKAGNDRADALVSVLPALPPPVAGFVVIPPGFSDFPVAGVEVALVDQSANATSWTWTVDGVVVATSQNHTYSFATPGVHTVSLAVGNRNGTDSVSSEITVLQPLNALFLVPPANPEVGTAVTFTDASSGATSWSWTVAGAVVGTDPDLVYTFPASGSYEVVLTVSNANGNDSWSETIVVDPAPAVVLDVAIRPNPAVTGEVTEFEGIRDPSSGPITAWQIDYGDGSAVETSTDGLFSHTYAVAGSYPVTITGFGPLTSSTFMKSLGVANPPPPLIQLGSVVPAAPEAGQTVTVTASELAGSGAIVSWAADFGDGSPIQTSLGPVFSHSYPSSGPYVITITAIGPVESASVTAPITVAPPPAPLVTGLTAAPTVGTTGSPVVFTPAVSGGAVTSWQWLINGLVQPGATGATFGHTFLAQDVYTVSVTATGPGGSSSFSIPFSVFDPPVPLTPVPSNPTPVDGDTVTFTSGEAVGSGPVSTWSWEVDGVPMAGSGATLTATLAEGIHTITVFGVGPSGAIGSATLAGFVVDPPPPPPAPIADFTFVLVGPDATFTDTSTGVITTWQWDFGDGASSTLQNPPPHTYVPGATYPVSLLVTGPGGESSFSGSVVVPP